MDPGIGLVVNSIAPNLPDIPKLPPKSMLQLPEGFLEKPHLRHALKYMTNDEQREKALEVAMTWKKKFAAENWRPVIAAITDVTKEDHLRSSLDVADLNHHNTFVHPAERPRAMTAASAPEVPQATSWSISKSAGLMRQQTASASLPFRRTPAPITPRTCRWDVIAPGPVTPLSPIPIGNSFAERAFWHIPTPQGEHYEASKHVKAMTSETESPIVLKDAEARCVYQKVKDEMEAVARRYYLARFNTRAFGDDDVVPVTLIKPKDLLEAAQVVLDTRRVKLKEVIIKDLPERLRCRAVEATLQGRLCIDCELDVAKQNDSNDDEALVPVPEVLNKNKDSVLLTVHSFLTILDKQREALHNSRTRRESTDLKLSDMALEAAWAVRILEDAECLVAAEADNSSSSGDDDDGYSYGNFLRRIKSELSTSKSSSSGAVASMVDELSKGQNKLSIPKSNEKHSTSLHRRWDLRIATGTIEEISSSEISPENRELRHRGPNRADLDYWAEELKKMEAMRAERQRSPTVHRWGHPRDIKLGCSMQQHTPTQQIPNDRFNVSASSPRQLFSWFSSSSSSAASAADSHALQTQSRSSHLDSSPSPSCSTDTDKTRPTMLDHEFYQRILSKSPAKMHRRDTSKTSVHEPSRRQQSVSSMPVLVKKTTKEEEDEWMSELRRMDCRERTRQANERRRVFQLSEGDDWGEREDGA